VRTPLLLPAVGTLRLLLTLRILLAPDIRGVANTVDTRRASALRRVP